MKFDRKALFILILIGSLNTVLSAEEKPNTITDNNIDNVTITEQTLNTASSPYRNLSADEVINTMYPDPLAEGFMGKRDSALDFDRNRSVKDMLEEFEGQAKVINDATVVPEDIKDNHTKEDRERIEARAEFLLKEKALNDSADNKGQKRVKDNTQDVEILYKEDLATDSINVASSSTDLASDSYVVDTYQDINTAQIKDWPQTDEDPEFSENKVNEASEDETEIILIDDGSKPLPDEIPDYTSMSGIVADNSIVNESNEVKDKHDTKVNKTSKRERLKRKMAIPLEPILLTLGKPKDENDESEKTFSYSGLLIPEKQPISRRKKMIRWTLQLDDGTRIPIKSNLKLLQEVRKEENLDDYVTITGKMRKSALEEQLKYFVPETIVKGKKGQQGEVVDDKKFKDKKDKNISRKELSRVDNKIEAKDNDSEGVASNTVISPESATEIIIASVTQQIADNVASDTVTINEIIPEHEEATKN